MCNRTTLLFLGGFSALIILVGLFYLLFTQHADVGLSLITVGIATSAVTGATYETKKTSDGSRNTSRENS
jgi:dolichol kinase